METATKTKSPRTSTDKVLEALATLAALLDRTINEVRHLENDFDNRLLAAGQEAELALRAKAAEQLNLARQEVQTELTGRFQAELRTALETLQSDFATERQRLGGEFQSERERLSKELQRAIATSSGLQVERSRLVAEIQRLKDQSAAELERVRAEAESANARAIADLNLGLPATDAEIQVIERKLAEVLRIIEDPETELSVVIRKNVEKLELESYLRGLRFGIGARHG